MFFFFNFEFPSTSSELLKGNKGEWAEVYIFLTLLADGKVFAADKNMQKIAERYLKILKIFREEIVGHKFEYIPGALIEIIHNGEKVDGSLPVTKVLEYKNKIWALINSSRRGSISDEDVQTFLRHIFVTKLKSPSADKGFFGGTKDIVMEVEDYKSGIASIVGFSCKSDFSGAATLFNASKNNTNFQFKIIGPMTDAIAQDFNSLVDIRGEKQVIATAKRMRLLKEHNCHLVFDNMVEPTARRNLIMVGGSETPLLIAEMLRHYYYDGEGASSFASISELIQWLSDKDIASFGASNLSDVYRYKISHLLYAMFTGMRLGNVWNGRSSVTGGYIVARNDGDVLAYHTCIADEFMDFLVEHLALEQPSHVRHLSMHISKSKDGEYFIKLPLQIRFKTMRQESEE